MSLSLSGWWDLLPQISLPFQLVTHLFEVDSESRKLAAREPSLLRRASKRCSLPAGRKLRLSSLNGRERGLIIGGMPASGLERPAIIITVHLALEKTDYAKRMYIALTRALATVCIIDSRDALLRDPILRLLVGIVEDLRSGRGGFESMREAGRL